MKSLKINDVTYEVQIIPLHLSPLTTRYSVLAKTPAESVEKGKALGSEIKSIIDLVLEAVVTPKPKEEDKTRLFNFALSYTSSMLKKDLKLFRESPES